MFSSSTDHIANAAKLLTASAAFAANPGLKSGLSVYDAAKRVWRSPPKGLARMATEIETLGNAALKGFAHDLPDDAPVLFEQMVTASLPDAAEIAACQMNADLLAARMLAGLSDPEHLRAPMPALFSAITVPALTRLLASKDFAADLTPAVFAQLLQDGADLQSGMTEVQGLLQAVLTGQYIPLDGMKQLAAQFGAADIEDAASLTRFLSLKAREYEALKSDVAAIDPGLKQLSALKKAARAAIDAVDLPKVETLLAEVQQVELTEAAKTAELRAQNALLRGKVDQAFDLLAAAADSFRALDPLAPARRRIDDYLPILRDHALRFGGEGLGQARALLAPVLTADLRQADPHLWAEGENWRAVLLQNEGSRTMGDQGDALLAEAITAYDASLAARPRAEDPAKWAMTQNNRGNALSHQAMRACSNAMTELLETAIAAYDAALEVFTPTQHPEDWAMAHNNRGNTRQTQAHLHQGADALDLLARATDDFKAALTMRNRDTDPDAWAATQNNLAANLATIALMSPGPAARIHMTDAIDAFGSVCAVMTPLTDPAGWANAQRNIAIALQARAGMQGNPAPRDDLQSALEAIKGAEAQLDPRYMPRAHDNAATLRAEIETALQDA